MMRSSLSKQGYDRGASVRHLWSSGTTIRRLGTSRWFRSSKKKSPSSCQARAPSRSEQPGWQVKRRGVKLGQRALIQLDPWTNLWMELRTKQFVTILRSIPAQSFPGITKARDISGWNGLNQDVMVQVCGVSMQRWLGGAAGLAAAGSAGMAVAGPQLALPLGRARSGAGAAAAAAGGGGEGPSHGASGPPWP